MSVLDHSISIYRYFEEICEIPHGSYEEKAIADYVENFAKERNLEYVRDQMGNLVIYKNGTPGSEDHAPLMLQAHIDMVNEKNKDSSHDFSKDGLELYVEDGWLSAKGTTLGGDDGYGAAYMLSILADDTLKHPPLVCVFTVQEEVGLCGAMGMDPSLLKADRLINLDSEAEGHVCVSSSGGRDVLVERELPMLPNALPGYSLEITGLSGGHSGGEIHKEKGNANKIAARILFALVERTSGQICLSDMNGGLKDNAIPRECFVTFASSAEKQCLMEVVEQSYRELKEELEFCDPGLKVVLREISVTQAASSEDSRAAITMMFLAPNGMQARSMVIEGLTTVSLNMGVVRLTDGKLIIHHSLRSPMLSAREQMTLQLKTISELFGATCQITNDYPGWNYEEQSPLRKAFREYYREITGKEIVEEATHGGLETGVFKGYNPKLDIISIGPDMEGAHTPDERMNLRSFLNMYQVLVGFLEIL